MKVIQKLCLRHYLGCVTILSNIPNHKELVDHSKTGFIFDKKEGSLETNV